MAFQTSNIAFSTEERKNFNQTSNYKNTSPTKNSISDRRGIDSILALIIQFKSRAPLYFNAILKYYIHASKSE